MLVTVETGEEVLRLATVLLQFYREHGEYKERLYDFVPRLGLAEIRAIVLDPERSGELLERFKIAKAAVTDPWLERDEPYHPLQFAGLDDVAPQRDQPTLVGPPEEGVL